MLISSTSSRCAVPSHTFPPSDPAGPLPRLCAHLYPPSARDTAPPRPPPTSDAYRSTQSRSAATSQCSAGELQMAMEAPPLAYDPPWHMSRHPRSMPHDVCNGSHDGCAPQADGVPGSSGTRVALFDGRCSDVGHGGRSEVGSFAPYAVRVRSGCCRPVAGRSGPSARPAGRAEAASAMAVAAFCRADWWYL